MSLKQYVRDSISEYITIFKTNFAKKNGDAAQIFKIKNPVDNDDAVSLMYASDNYAKRDGSIMQTFNVQAPTAAEHAVNKAYAETNFITSSAYVDITSVEAQEDYDTA